MDRDFGELLDLEAASEGVSDSGATLGSGGGPQGRRRSSTPLVDLGEQQFVERATPLFFRVFVC